MDRLSLVRDFWNATPCDGQPTYEQRARFRYGKDGWLLPFLNRIAASHQCILEVGCGQGTDGVTLCRKLRPDQRYVGVDVSDVSLIRARAAAEEVLDNLGVIPAFQLGNAEQLSFSDNSFDCVFSVGVLHHTNDTERAIGEVRRVLAPGGTAFIGLYRTLAPKVFVAHFLRAFQNRLDASLRTDRLLYRALGAINIGERHGTAIYECFGVPILRSYTRSQVSNLFRGFSSMRLSSHGFGLLPAAMNRKLVSNPLGYLWLAEVVK
jgi:SAM-dependent methyltransferase